MLPKCKEKPLFDRQMLDMQRVNNSFAHGKQQTLPKLEEVSSIKNLQRPQETTRNSALPTLDTSVSHK